MNIIEAAKAAGDDWDSTLPSDKEFLERFAKIISDQSLEEAAEKLEKQRPWITNVAAANVVRALKGAKE